MTKQLLDINMFLKRLIFIGLSFFSTAVFGQSIISIENKIDSIFEVSNTEPQAYNKLHLLNLAYDLSLNNNLYLQEEKSLLEQKKIYSELNIKEQEFSSLLKLSYTYERNNNHKNLIETYMKTGKLLFGVSIYSVSKEYFKKCEGLFEFSNNIDLKNECLLYLGDISAINNEHIDAISYYRKSLKYSKESNNTKNIVSTYQLIGKEFQKSEEYNAGIKYYKTILGQLEFTASSKVKGIIHNDIALLYSKKKNYDLAEKHLNSALKNFVKDKNDLTSKANVHVNLAIVYQKTNRQYKALEQVQKAYFISKNTDDKKLERDINYLTSNLYFYNGDNYNSLNYIDKAIEKSDNYHDSELLAKSLLFKSKIYAEMGNYELERDYNSRYLIEDAKIKNKEIKLEQIHTSTSINYERIEKEVLQLQKKNEQRIANEEARNADRQKAKARESSIIRDRALAQAQHEIDKSKIIEIERNSALQKAKQDSLSAVYAKVQEDIALEKSRTDSIAVVYALQKQRNSQKEVEIANERVNRTRLIGILLIIIIAIVIVGLYRQRKLNSQIELEKERSDELLLNILPEKIADELKRKQKVSPRKFEQVSVLFTDFVGFTRTAEILSEDELIEELDRYFNKFDEIIEKYNLEKIKTIGDSYMCAGGVPIPNSTNALDSINAGLEIAEFVSNDAEKRKKSGLPYWEIRIGVNTGSVIAGVVGSKKFAFDIWGDTVNIASRIESNGLKGNVNISENTYNIVKSNYKCVSRGMIIAKNKGPVPMYYIDIS